MPHGKAEFGSAAESNRQDLASRVAEKANRKPAELAPLNGTENPAREADRPAECSYPRSALSSDGRAVSRGIGSIRELSVKTAELDRTEE